MAEIFLGTEIKRICCVCLLSTEHTFEVDYSRGKYAGTSYEDHGWKQTTTEHYEMHEREISIPICSDCHDLHVELKNKLEERKYKRISSIAHGVLLVLFIVFAIIGYSLIAPACSCKSDEIERGILGGGWSALIVLVLFAFPIHVIEEIVLYLFVRNAVGGEKRRIENFRDFGYLKTPVYATGNEIKGTSGITCDNKAFLREAVEGCEDEREWSTGAVAASMVLFGVIGLILWFHLKVVYSFHIEEIKKVEDNLAHAQKFLRAGDITRKEYLETEERMLNDHYTWRMFITVPVLDNKKNINGTNEQK